jgi:hypothetical protein
MLPRDTAGTPRTQTVFEIAEILRYQDQNRHEPGNESILPGVEFDQMDNQAKLTIDRSNKLLLKFTNGHGDDVIHAMS